MRRTKKRHGGARGKKRGGKGGRKWGAQGATSSTLSGPRVSPDELDVKLMFRKTAYINDAGANLVTKEFYANGAYDVDPSLGSTETYGFDEYAALYSYYRVVGYKYSCTFVNQGQDPMMCYVLNTNTSPASSGTRYDLYSTNPYCKSKLVNANANTATTLSGSIQISRLLGSRAVETADTLRALTTSVPVDLIFCSIGAESISASAGIYFSYDFKITMKIRFYGREVDLTLAGLMARMERQAAARQELLMRKKLLQKTPSQRKIEVQTSRKEDSIHSISSQNVNMSSQNVNMSSRNLMGRNPQETQVEPRGSVTFAGGFVVRAPGEISGETGESCGRTLSTNGVFSQKN